MNHCLYCKQKILDRCPLSGGQVFSPPPHWRRRCSTIRRFDTSTIPLFDYLTIQRFDDSIRDVNKMLHDETVTLMPRDETKLRRLKNTSETETLTSQERDRDVGRVVQIKVYLLALFWYVEKIKTHILCTA